MSQTDTATILKNFANKITTASVKERRQILTDLIPCVKSAGEVLVFYLPIRFFYYLANLIIFTRSSRIPCIFFLEGGFKGIYLREKNFTLSYVVSEI